MGMSKTSTGMPIGTPAYMAPEQAAGGKINHQTDLYAFGIILFETVAERPPFVAQTVVQLLAAHMNEPPPPLNSLVEKVSPDLVAKHLTEVPAPVASVRPGVPPALAKAVDQLLAKEPADRPADMAVVREELTRLRDLAIQDQTPLFGEVMPFEAKPVTRKPPPPKSKSSGSKGLVFGLGGLMLLAAGVGIAKLAVKQEEPKPPVVIEAPRPPVEPKVIKPGRVNVSTNTLATRVYLDKSATERSEPGLS